MAPIAICICTYNRPEGLKAALRSLDGQQLTTLSDDQIVVIAVDNSAGGSAKAICEAYAENGRFVFRYVHQPAKGLVHARNTCLAAAEQEQAVNMLFLDDDEAAAPSWVEALLGRLAQSGAAAAIGPVFPVFERAPSAWLPVHRFVNRVKEVGGFTEDGHTCNAAISMAAIRAGHLSFDLRFNETGGEDTMFFKALRARGESHCLGGGGARARIRAGAPHAGKLAVSPLVSDGDRRGAACARSGALGQRTNSQCLPRARAAERGKRPQPVCAARPWLA